MSEHLVPFGDPNSPSKTEQAKKQSNYLRGGIREALENGEPTFSHEDYEVLKFHGIYQQDDRDARAVNKAIRRDREYIFMIRVKIPGGQLTPDQYLALDRVADDVVHNRSIRVTTRQNVQLHGVLKHDLKHTIQHVNSVLLSTLCGCGDVERNIMAPPAPVASDGHRAARALAHELTEAMTPQSRAYHEIWLDGEKVDSSEEAEPVYGDQYLPRKFKTGIALPDDNSIDVHSQDVGLVALLDHNGNLDRVNVLVGGGHGMTHKKPETYVRVGTPLGSVDPEHVTETVQTIAQMFRDYGDRTNRKHARLKYVIEEQGIDAFREEFKRRASFELKPWVEMPPVEHRDWLGAHEQGDGKYFYGVRVDNGRIIDYDHCRQKTAFRKIVEALRPSVTLTPNQNVIFGDLDQKDIKTIERVLKGYHVPTADQMTATRRYAMSCPALPTCGLALSESERVFGGVVDAFERELGRLGMEEEPITIRMTGCPNGCARPYTADIGLVGHRPGHYDIFIGGRLAGDRLGDLYAPNVAMEQVVPTLRPLLEAWQERRMPDECFGDFYQRLFGVDPNRATHTGGKDNPARERVEAELAATPA